MRTVAKGIGVIIALAFPLWGQLIVTEVRENQLSSMNTEEKIEYYQDQLAFLERTIPFPRGCLAYAHGQSVNYYKERISELSD